jgi:hypothetical protein
MFGRLARSQRKGVHEAQTRDDWSPLPDYWAGFLGQRFTGPPRVVGRSRQPYRLDSAQMGVDAVPMRKPGLAGLGLLVTACVIVPALLMSRDNKGYCLLLGVQLLSLLFPFLLVALGLSAVGSFFRRIGGSCGFLPRQRWRWVSAEGLMVGLVGAGAWLVWSPRDVYFSPTGSEMITFQEPSPLQTPLGIGPCSGVFKPVTVTYTDGHSRSFVQESWEETPLNATARVLNRTIQWGLGSPARAVVILPETGLGLFFPERVTNNFCPPDGAVATYLRDAPVQTVERMCGGRSAALH